MPLILRIDVDKPYGHHNFRAKIASKISENYFNVNWFMSDYLMPLKKLLINLNQHEISAFIYFRHCTLPDDQVFKLMDSGGHHLGIHSENTKSEESFLEELKIFKEKTGRQALSFTKHGSGVKKLGKNHYPKYEENKYLEWSNRHLNFYFGNGILNNKNISNSTESFFPNMFWIHRDYRDKNFSKISSLIKKAKTENICLIVHPSNFYTYDFIKDDLKNIIKKSKKNGINWFKPGQQL